MTSRMERLVDFLVSWAGSAERSIREEMLRELAPALCARHYAPGGCDGPLQLNWSQAGRIVPICAQHAHYLAQEPHVIQVQLGATRTADRAGAEPAP